MSSRLMLSILIVYYAYLDKIRVVRIPFKPKNTKEWFECQRRKCPAMRAADVGTPGFPELSGLPRLVPSAKVPIGTPHAYGR